MLVFASQDGITKFLVKEFSVAQLLMVRYWVFVVCVVGYLAWKGELRGAVRSKLPRLQVVR
jgi:hypothetical protein